MIDAIGPFFKEDDRVKINWSKIPFDRLHLHGPQRDKQFSQIRTDMKQFASRVSAIGYNAVTLDDVSHLTAHEWYGEKFCNRIRIFQEEFEKIFDILRDHDLAIYVTMDVLTTTAELRKNLEKTNTDAGEFLEQLLNRFLTRWPQVSGVILRIGESDGLDVESELRSELFLRHPQQLNQLLRRLLRVFEERDKHLILRTWTVGAYPIGDLIWHRNTLTQTLEGLDSPAFILSMKHGETDFFRYLPLNANFFRTRVQKIVELQSKREYEGCGEFPSFIGFEYERLAREIAHAPNMVGICVWCQTGGWVPFRRLAYIGEGSPWTEINTQVTVDIFRYGLSVEKAIARLGLGRHTSEMRELLRLSHEVIVDLYYHPGFAPQKLFFRRVRIPPLIGIYWNTIFVNHSLRKVLRYFTVDPSESLRAASQSLQKLERMIQLAHSMRLAGNDLVYMRDTLNIIALSREYYHLPFDESICERLSLAKYLYQRRYPRGTRYRYAIQLNFRPFRIRRKFLKWALVILLRRRRGYRIVDHLFTLHLLSVVYRFVRRTRTSLIPEFARKSAMGIDTIFR